MKQVCRICKVSKELTDYHKDPSKKIGVCNVCKSCRKELNRLTQIKRTEKMNLNQSKFNSIFNGLSSVVRKTYEAVPIMSRWDASQVHNELIRTGSAGDLKTTVGCLNTLVSSGLVSEPVRGSFIRIVVKQKPTPNAPSLKVEKESKPLTPMETLFAIAARVKSLSDMASELAKEIEESALVVTEELEAESEDTQKLRQLQQILKSLG